MALDDDVNEDLVVGSDDGNLSLSFDSPEAKQRFLEIMGNFAEKKELVQGEGYKCGHCAAYPCFRTPESQLVDGPFMKRFFAKNPHLKGQYEKRIKQEAEQPAGACFQVVRQCRETCSYFLKDDGSGKAPYFQITGTCRVDKADVNYKQECHIPEHRTKIRKPE